MSRKEYFSSVPPHSTYEAMYYFDSPFGNRRKTNSPGIPVYGKSAYDLAVEQGFKGTIEEWLASLKGENGLTPHIGENGNWFIGDIDTNIAADAIPVWNSLAEAEDYAANDETAYVGQILSVIDRDNNTSKIYIIANENKDLVEVPLQNDIEELARQASQSAITAGNYAAQAIQAKIAIDQKIWYGTMEEYNNLDRVSNSTIYIILHE